MNCPVVYYTAGSVAGWGTKRFVKSPPSPYDTGNFDLIPKRRIIRTRALAVRIEVKHFVTSGERLVCRRFATSHPECVYDGVTRNVNFRTFSIRIPAACPKKTNQYARHL